MRLLLLAPALLLAASATTRPAATPSATPPTATGMPAGPQALAPDHSLTPDAYLALGLPAVDRSWTPLDHDTASGVLDGRDVLELPRRGSPRSGVVFARLSDRAAYAIVDDRSTPLQARIGIALAGLQGDGALVKRYAAAHAAGRGSFAPELFDLLCLNIHATRKVSALAAEVPAPPPGDAGREGFDDALAQMRGGLAQVLQGTVMSLKEPAGPADRLRLAACLEAEVPVTLVHLSSQGQVEARGMVRKAAAGEKDPEVKLRLDRLDRALNEVAPAPSSAD